MRKSLYDSRMLSFSILLALGTLAGLSWVALQPPHPAAMQHVTAGAWALLGGLAGGRLTYVAVNWAYFQDQRASAAQFWLGGMSGPGALAGGLAALAMYALLLGPRQALGRFARQADALLPLLAGLSAAAWLGCWQEGVAYGAAYSPSLVPAGARYDPTLHPWYALHSPDEWGRSLPRLPLQPAAALLSITAAWLAESLATWMTAHRATRRAPTFYQHTSRYHRVTHLPGLRAALGLFFLALAWLLVSLLRADPVPLWNGQPLDLWFNLVLLGVAGLAAGGILIFNVSGKLLKFLELRRREETRER